MNPRAAQRLRSSGQQHLDAWFHEKNAQGHITDPLIGELWVLLHDAVSGGKLFRPRLFDVVYRSLGGLDRDYIGTVAASIEMLHGAFIAHDDVIDQDRIRRGVPNLNGHYFKRQLDTTGSLNAARTVGDTAGILGGDLALSGALIELGKIDLPHQQRSELLDVFSRAIDLTVAGEFMDVSHSNGTHSVSVDTSLRISYLKTAVYSFELPMQAGAILAGASTEVQNLLADIGRNVGIAYQIVDDLLAVYGDSEKTGKSVDSDLLQLKPTTIMCHAASTPSWPRIVELINDASTNPHALNKVREILIDCGAKAFAENLLQQHADRTVELMNSALLPDSIRSALFVIVSATLVRAQ